MSTSLGGLSSILGLMNNLPSLLSIIDKLFYFGICMSLGGLVMRGWKRYKNWSINIIGSVGFGILIIIGGVLLSQVIPIQLPFLEGILQALITAVILYIILALITGGVSTLGKLVTSEQFLELKKNLESLKTEFLRLRAVLERKNIMPEKLAKKELEKKLNEILETKQIKQYETISWDEKEDMATFVIKDNKLNQYKAIFDSYTGENTSFMQVNLKLSQKIANGFRMIGHNPRILSGVIIAAVMAFLLLSLVNETAITKITDRLAILQGTGTTLTTQQSTLTNYQINNTSCPTVTDVLYLIGTQNYTSLENSINITGQLSQKLIARYPNETIMNGMQITNNGRNYMLALTSTMTEQEFQTALQTYFQNNMLSIIQGNIDFCAIKYKGLTIDNYIHACSVRQNDNNICDCRLLKDVNQFCFVFSDIISSQISNQLGTQGTSQGTQGTGSLLGLLGNLK